MAFLTKTSDEILHQALQKVASDTGINNLTPGSVTRSIIEAVTTELGEFYSVLDFNFSLNTISGATGRALDLIGSLYNVERKTLSTLATIDAQLGVFYFYLAAPYFKSVLIPAGTMVSTTTNLDLGSVYTYQTTTDAQIPAGRTRAYASLKPATVDSVFGVGINSLVINNFVGPPTVFCTNPKPISPQVGLESDDAYRLRVVQAVRTNAGGTIDALRFAGLSVNGVRDILIRNSPFGLGSVQAVIVTEDNTLSNVVLGQAASAMTAVRPVGIRLYVAEPNFLPLDVTATIVLNTTAADPTTIASQVQVGIIRFINALTVGQTLVYNQLVQAVLDATDAVADVVISNYAINGEQVLRKNFTPDSDEQIIPGSIIVTT